MKRLLRRIAGTPLRASVHQPAFTAAIFQRWRPLHRTLCSAAAAPLKGRYRTHHCERLETLVGQSVTLSGWLHAKRDFGSVLFLVLRDSAGQVQLNVAEQDNAEVYNLLSSTPLESVIQITGEVRHRPGKDQRPEQGNGLVEVALSEASVLNTAVNVPVQVHQLPELSEEVRLRHRHIDLRGAQLQGFLKLRSQVTHAIRSYLIEAQRFLEVETPTLFKSTPEGAREFLVPTRQPGKFYALTQSPQQYKQLLMVGGIERYFQIARCYRDESGRADRQPEFTQVDIEMAFTTAAEVQEVVEGLLAQAWHTAMGLKDKLPCAIPARKELVLPLPRLTYRECMMKYGSDKPDRRFGLVIHGIATVISNAKAEGCSIPEAFEPFLGSATLYAIAAKGFAALSRKELDQLQQSLRQQVQQQTGTPSSQVMAVKVKEGGEWQGGIGKQTNDTVRGNINAMTGAEPGDLLIFIGCATAAGSTEAAHPSYPALSACGVARQELIAWAKEKDLTKAQVVEDIVPQQLQHCGSDMFWVTEFPMFEASEEGNDGLQSCHHPFTAPTDLQAFREAVGESDAQQRQQRLLALTAQHYDIVCNGMEAGGGSIRIHNPKDQLAVIHDVLNLPPSQVQGFSHLVSALGHGAPPHGGIALGLDRLIATLCGVQNIRDVIAFPKSAGGNELMTGSPSFITEAQAKEYHFELLKKGCDEE